MNAKQIAQGDGELILEDGEERKSCIFADEIKIITNTELKLKY